jgi:DNA-binding response OmpR family regulator
LYNQGIVGGMMKDKRRKILIIDPDTKIRKEYSSFFSDRDFDVETSPGITRAVEKIKNIGFDCIIIDVNLPEMRGYEAVQILKTIDPKVQIIITAAENTRELELKVREQDIFYYYIKSFDKEELRLAVNGALEKVGKGKKMKTMNRPAKILIVDDDKDLVEATRIVLENKRYDVEVAYNRSEAMDKIKKAKPDLILLDIMMDRLDDGFTICYKLKHDINFERIPVLVISSIREKTGYQYSPKPDDAYFKADDYAEKPIQPADLLQRIEKLLTK